METYEELRDQLLWAAQNAGLEIALAEDVIETRSLTKTFNLHCVLEKSEGEPPAMAEISFAVDPVVMATLEISQGLLDEAEAGEDDGAAEEPLEDEESGEEPDEDEDEDEDELPGAIDLEVRFHFGVPEGTDPEALLRRLRQAYLDDVDPEYEPLTSLVCSLAPDSGLLAEGAALSVGWAIPIDELAEYEESDEEDGPADATLVAAIMEEVVQTLEVIEQMCAHETPEET